MHNAANSPANVQKCAYLVAKAHQPAGVRVHMGMGSEGLSACSRPEGQA